MNTAEILPPIYICDFEPAKRHSRWFKLPVFFISKTNLVKKDKQNWTYTLQLLLVVVTEIEEDHENGVSEAKKVLVNRVVRRRSSELPRTEVACTGNGDL